MWALKIKRKFNSLHLVPQKNLTLSARTSCAGREAFEKREMAPKCVCLAVCLSVCLYLLVSSDSSSDRSFSLPSSGKKPWVNLVCESKLCRKGGIREEAENWRPNLPAWKYVYVCLSVYLYISLHPLPLPLRLVALLCLQTNLELDARNLTWGVWASDRLQARGSEGGRGGIWEEAGRRRKSILQLVCN